MEWQEGLSNGPNTVSQFRQEIIPLESRISKIATKKKKKKEERADDIATAPGRFWTPEIVLYSHQMGQSSLRQCTHQVRREREWAQLCMDKTIFTP